MKKNKSTKKRDRKIDESTLDQGFVKKEDLEPGTKDRDLMTPDELDSFAEKAKSSIRSKGDELQGEGDYEAAESYNEAVEDFARRQGGEIGKP
jgi:hypothetical protein